MAQRSQPGCGKLSRAGAMSVRDGDYLSTNLNIQEAMVTRKQCKEGDDQRVTWPSGVSKSASMS